MIEYLMPNQIEKELKLANQKLLKPIKGTSLVELSLDNVAIVEAMIQNDSAYLKSADKKAIPRYNKKGKAVYAGSTAYWMTRLKEILVDKQNIDKFEHIIAETVCAVDRENSTHLNADGKGREELVARICSLGRKGLLESLKRADHSLVAKIAEKTSAIKPRRNLSFASKFCHYACFYLFEGLPEQDNYSICDNIVKKILPRYVEHYKLTSRNLECYKEYQKTIDEIITKSHSKISRNGFDHLLWYYFKGRI